MRTVAVVQARMASTRLPGKALLPLSKGRTLLDAVLDTLQECVGRLGGAYAGALTGGAWASAEGLLADLVVATTTRPEDDAIGKHCRARQVAVFRGEAENVLDRFLRVAEAFQADALLRVCADNPLLAPELVEELVRFAHPRRPDYAGYRTATGVPAICTAGGLVAEWVATEALRRLARSPITPQMAEHVTLGIYTQSGYDTAWLPLPDWADQGWLRLTCDTAEDLDRLRYIVSRGPVAAGRQALVAWIAQQPALVQAMRLANQAQPKPAVLIPPQK